MEQKTALQELIEWIKEERKKRIPTTYQIENKITELLPKERQQIIDARIDGIKKALGTGYVNPKTSEDYFTNTFNQ